MDCTTFDQRLLSSPFVSSLPLDALAIISGSVQVDNGRYLDTLARVAIQPSCTSLILTYYEPIFPDLVARWGNFASVEKVLAGFGRVLPVIPHLSEMAEEFVLHSPALASPKFLSIISCPSLGPSVREISAASDDETLDMLLSIHRLLCFRRNSFLGLVNPENISMFLEHRSRAIRYLSVRILCIFLKASDAAQEEMFTKHSVGGADERVMGLWEGKEVDYGVLM
jgi:midasin